MQAARTHGGSDNITVVVVDVVVGDDVDSAPVVAAVNSDFTAVPDAAGRRRRGGAEPLPDVGGRGEASRAGGSAAGPSGASGGSPGVGA